MITYTQFQQTFTQTLQDHRLWQHPYFNRIHESTPLPVLRDWAIQAGRIDQAFVQILSQMVNNPTINNTEPLLENLADEQGHGNPADEHFTLFTNVLGIIGVNTEQYNQTPQTPSTRMIIDTLLYASQRTNPLMTLGMMASEELLCPQEFPRFLQALRQYGTQEQLRYFPVHIEADVEHAQELIQLCYDHCQTDQDIEQIQLWQRLDLELNVAFYDDLEKRASR